MLFRNVPLRKKLIRILLLLNGIILCVTCITFFLYEVYIFRKTTTDKLSTIGKIIAVNSTAALAFNDEEAATEILSALKAEKSITTACLFDKNGKLFLQYNVKGTSGKAPAIPGAKGLLPQMYRNETHITNLVTTLLKAAYCADYPPLNNSLRLFTIVIKHQ